MTITAATATVRRLGAADLTACMDLGADRGWPREDHKWRLLFDIAQVHGIDDPAGGLAAAVVGVPYGDAVTAVSMMLVARAHERRGLGRRVLAHTLERTATAGALLTATPMGKPLYEAMGFRVVGRCATYGGTLTGVVPAGVSHPYADADRVALSTLDTEVFGAPRAALTAALPAFATALRVVDSPHRARRLRRGVAQRRRHRPRPGHRARPRHRPRRARRPGRGHPGTGQDGHRPPPPEVIGWAARHRLERRFTTDVMVLGPDIPGDPARGFTPVMLALG